MAETSGITAGGRVGGWVPRGAKYGGGGLTGGWLVGTNRYALGIMLGSMVTGGIAAAYLSSGGAIGAGVGYYGRRVGATRALAYATRTGPAARVTTGLSGLHSRSLPGMAFGRAGATRGVVFRTQFGRGVASSAVPIVGVRSSLRYATTRSKPLWGRFGRIGGHALGAAIVGGIVVPRAKRAWDDWRQGGGGPGAGGASSSGGRGSMCEHYAHCL